VIKPVPIVPFHCNTAGIGKLVPDRDLKSHPSETSKLIEDQMIEDEIVDDEVIGNEIMASAQSTLRKNLAFPTPNMDIPSMLNPLPPPAPPPRKYCNKPYNLEQIHFLQYCRDDLNKLPWPDIVALYLETFSEPARDVCIGGLQCRYYRAQLYPMLCIEGKPVQSDGGTILLRGITVRYRGQKEGLTVPILDNNRRPVFNNHGSVMMRELTEDELHGPLGSNLRMKYEQYYDLSDRTPELAAKYEWVKSERRKEAKRKGVSLTKSSISQPQRCHANDYTATYRLEHGIVLPAAVLPPAAASEETMLLEDARTCCDSCANLASEIIRRSPSGPVDRKLTG
jgi:hypothetical protein